MNNLKQIGIALLGITIAFALAYLIVTIVIATRQPLY